MTLTRILTLAALTGSALAAGVYFAYGNSVMPSLERLPDGQGSAAMIEINEVIYNPLFMLTFNGVALVCLVLPVIGFIKNNPGKWWLLAGSVLYLVGVVITIAVNVPLSDQLAEVDPNTPEGAAEWSRFVKYWNPTNNLRAIAGTLGVIAFGLALTSRDRPESTTAKPANQVQQHTGPQYYGPQHQGPGPRRDQR